MVRTLRITNMKLWLLTQSTVNGYDTFDGAVVAANTEEEARGIHPKTVGGLGLTGEKWDDRIWAPKERVTVEYLGDTDRDISGVILASFNAG